MANLNQTIAPLSTIIGWFAEDAQPTNVQFETTWKSFFHKSENIPVEQIYQLTDVLNNKAEREHLHLDLAKRDGSNLSVDDINGLKEVLGVALAANGIINNIEPTITSEDANSLQDGIYKPKTTGVYSSIGLTAKENYTTLFKKLDGVWSVFSEEELPVQEGKNVLSPTGDDIPKEKAVADFVDLKFFYENLPLGKISKNVITQTGNITSHPGYNCTDFIIVRFGDEIFYEGKVTSASNESTNAYAVAGYDSEGIFIEFLLNNSVNGISKFKILNQNIKKIRACSRVDSDLKLTKKITKLNDELIPKTSEINPKGELIPNEQAVDIWISKRIEDSFFYQKIDLGEIIDANINVNGYPAANTGFDCSDYIKCEHGDEFKYEGKVTSVSSNTPGLAYAAAGYGADNYFIEYLLENDIDAFGYFKITNPDVVKLRVSSRKTYNLKLSKKINKIDSDKIEGFDALENRLQSLENNSEIGKYKTNLSWASIGDSITYAGGYQAKVMEKLDFTNFQNRGYAGKGFVDDEERGSILSNIQNIGIFDLYTLFGGTNDFRLDKELGVWEDYLNNTGSTTFYGALRKTIDLLYLKNPSCKIMVLTPLRRNNADYTSFSTNSVGYTLNDYRDALIKISEYEGLTLVDLFLDSGITDRNLSIYTSDGLHPRPAGHELISHRLITEIKRITA